MIRAATAMFVSTAMCVTPALAQAKDSFCVTDSELQDLLLVAAPAALGAMGEGCAAVLPNGMVLGNPQSALAKSVDAAAREAWPKANKMFIRVLLSDKGAPSAGNGELTYEQVNAGVRPMLGKLVTDKESCRSVDKMLKLLEPLPAQNFAGIFVEIVRLATKDNEKKKLLCS